MFDYSEYKSMVSEETFQKLVSIPVSLEWGFYRDYAIEILLSVAHRLAPGAPLDDHQVFDLLRNVPGLMDAKDAERTIRYSAREGLVMKCVLELESAPNFQEKLKEIRAGYPAEEKDHDRVECSPGLRR